MNPALFADYIRRFNAKDPTTFDDYLSPDLDMLNGHLHYRGIDGMKDHYARIWKTFDETVHCLRIVMDESSCAVLMWTHFETIHDEENSPLGSVKAGEKFDFNGVVMYKIENGKFSEIRVAYNSFIRTDLDGKTIEMGIPH